MNSDNTIYCVIQHKPPSHFFTVKSEMKIIRFHLENNGYLIHPIHNTKERVPLKIDHDTLEIIVSNPFN